MSDDDIRSAAHDGAVRAAQTFDPARGASFSTYAGTWVRNRVGKALEAWVAGTPAFGTTPGDDRTPRLDLIASPEPVGDDPEPPAGTPDITEELLGVLSSREREVVKIRFGIGVEGVDSFAQVGNRLGITGERAREIWARALRKLRAAREAAREEVPVGC